MHPFIRIILLWILVCSLTTAVAVDNAFGQAAGNQSGALQIGQAAHDIETGWLSDPRFIAVDGAAEIRVAPTEIRMVLAAVSEGSTAEECKQAAADLINRIQAGWLGMGIAESDVFEDFINILPVFEFEEKQLGSFEVMAEVLKRYRLQTNLHVKLKNDEQVQQALDVAFSHNVTDIVSFDYWSPELETVKTEALKKALQVARAKSEIVLSRELFPDRPRLVNVSESGTVVFPKQMYETYVNTVEQSMTAPYNWRQNVPRVSAPRPSTAYYTGPRITGDSLSSRLPMSPEISVVAKVRLYYESPFKDTGHDDDD